MATAQCFGASREGEDRLGQLEGNSALNAGGAVQDRRDERQHAVRNFVVDDGPLESCIRSELQPGRAVLGSHELRIGMKRAAVELGVDRIDAELASRGPQHDGGLAQPLAEKVE